jgi:metal-responsive CopG/Arc/MetJ family transcriptional regulator
MTTRATVRKLKRSLTLSVDVVAFVDEARKKRGASSESEAVDLLLREAMLDARRQELELACKEYYDTAADEELAEQREWAERIGPNMWIGVQE